MHFEQQDEGDYRIYASAFEVRAGRFRAEVSAVRFKGFDEAPKLAFRELELAEGYLWDSPQSALQFAVARVQNMIRTNSAALAC